MTKDLASPMRLTWLVPDDHGGGVVSVAQACCRKALSAGNVTTLLLALRPRGHAAEFGGIELQSLLSEPPHSEVPVRLVDWLTRNPQDILFLNSCEEADVAIPFVPQQTRLVYVVHDTAKRFFEAALRNEESLDCIVAVSETVAARFRHRLREPSKLHVALNGTVFPEEVAGLPSEDRTEDLVFLGGDKPIKGAYDALALWRTLQSKGYTGRLHWFGEVGSTFQAELDHLPAHERIIVHGRQPRLSIFKAAARSKAVLMLSRVEPFGMATIECMGMGCSPIAWDIPTGTREIVSPGDGAFARLGDFDDLAMKTLEAIGNHAHVFGPTTQRIRSEFSEDAMWKRYEAVIENLRMSSPAVRPRSSERPPHYHPPRRMFQFLPPSFRSAIRAFIGRRPWLGFVLRDFRGL